jgi:hypothetical protein
MTSGLATSCRPRDAGLGTMRSLPVARFDVRRSRHAPAQHRRPIAASLGTLHATPTQDVASATPQVARADNVLHPRSRRPAVLPVEIASMRGTLRVGARMPVWNAHLDSRMRSAANFDGKRFTAGVIMKLLRRHHSTGDRFALAVGALVRLATHRMQRVRPHASGALALGALAFGATALGALAIGRLAIGALALRRGRVGSLSIGDLEVDRLRVRELVVVARD